MDKKVKKISGILEKGSLKSINKKESRNSFIIYSLYVENILRGFFIVFPWHGCTRAFCKQLHSREAVGPIKVPLSYGCYCETY